MDYEKELAGWLYAKDALNAQRAAIVEQVNHIDEIINQLQTTHAALLESQALFRQQWNSWDRLTRS